MNMLEDVKLQAKIKKELIEAMCKFINDNDLTIQFINNLERIRSLYGKHTCYMDRFVSYFCTKRIKTCKLIKGWHDTVDKVFAPYFAKYLKDKKMYYAYRKYAQLQIKEGNLLARSYGISPKNVFWMNEDLKKWHDMVLKTTTFNYDYLYKCMII